MNYSIIKKINLILIKQKKFLAILFYIFFWFLYYSC